MKKLKHTAKRSFLMKKNIKNVVYELRISRTKIHKIFNVNSLTMKNALVIIIKRLILKNKKKKYEVNKILSEKKMKERTKFLMN